MVKLSKYINDDTIALLFVNHDAIFDYGCFSKLSQMFAPIGQIS